MPIPTNIKWVGLMVTVIGLISMILDQFFGVKLPNNTSEVCYEIGQFAIIIYGIIKNHHNLTITPIPTPVVIAPITPEVPVIPVDQNKNV